jgi:hypothetical protein
VEKTTSKRQSHGDPLLSSDDFRSLMTTTRISGHGLRPLAPRKQRNPIALLPHDLRE